MTTKNNTVQAQKKEKDPSTNPDLSWQDVGTCDKDKFHLSHFYDETED